MKAPSERAPRGKYAGGVLESAIQRTSFENGVLWYGGKAENKKTERERQMKKWFTDKKGCRIAACILSVVLLVLTALAFSAEGANGYCLPLAIILSLAAGGYLMMKVRFPRISSVLSLVTVPFLAMWLLQWYTCDPWRMYPAMIFLNSVFFYLFYLGLAFLLGNFRWGYSLAAALSMLIGLVNYFVVEFRSSPIVPWDLLSLGTAASVADNYTYDISWRLLYVSFGFVFLLLFSMKNSLKPRKLVFRLPAFLLCMALLFGTGSAIQKDSVKDFFGMDQTLFTPNVRYRNNGFVAAFVGNLHLINVEEPEGYSVEKAKEIVSFACSGNTEEVADSKETGDSGTGSEDFRLTQAPNIIVIMNEAFSDLSVLGKFGTNEDYMPFMRQLMEDYTSGQLMVSVKGGNTANTEYEFLSGDTMAFLPSGSVVYQQYIKSDVPTLVSNLKGLGYSTIAIHPYLGSGWDRDVVYPRLGFDEFLDIDSFEDPEYLRNFVNDKSAFDKVIEVFESKEEGERQFIFEVTMQNHSGYSKDYPDFSPAIKLTDFNTTSTSIQAAEKYLTLIKKSDEAFQELIAYFETVEEPTIVIMFGDHQPSDYITNVISRITGYDGEASLEEYQKAFLVPYVIWDNFGLEKDSSMELTSVNYLGAYLMELLNLPMSQYQEFLMQLSRQLPVICAGTYIDKDGTYHSYSEKDEVYGEMLNDYNILQYNHLTDRKNLAEELFTVETD